MYKASVRAMMRYSIRKLNDGDYSLMLKMASPDFELAVPWPELVGDHVPAATRRSATSRHSPRHRQKQQRSLNGLWAKVFSSRSRTSWSTGRPGTPGSGSGSTTSSPGRDGEPDVYNNRALLFLEVRWGRLVRWEDYEDTERVAAWDAARSARSGGMTGNR